MSHTVRVDAEYRLKLIRKTEIVTEYCYSFRSFYPDVSIFWISCDSLTKIELAFSNIAHILNLRGHDEPDTDVIQLVSRHLQQGHGIPWLLVLDSADDFELLTQGSNALAQLIPRYRGGTVIITTRDYLVAQVLTGTAHGILTVNRLSHQESLTLFRSPLPNDARLDEAIEVQIFEIQNTCLCV